MTGYNKGYKIKINDEIVTLYKDQIKDIGHYNTVCKVQEKIIKDYPDEFDDDISFNLAECAVSVLETYDNITDIDDAIREAIDAGFFPTRDGKVKTNTDSESVG